MVMTSMCPKREKEKEIGLFHKTETVRFLFCVQNFSGLPLSSGSAIRFSCIL